MRHTYLDRAPRAFLGLVIFTLLLMWPAFVRGQDVSVSIDTAATAAIYPTVLDPARSMLEEQWDDTDSLQDEHAYCVTSYTQAGYRRKDGYGIDIVIRVTAVQPAHVDSSGHEWAAFNCPQGQPELHTHPPASCYADGCHLGGPDAYECFPSHEDLMRLVARGDDWAVIQCDRHDFRFYYPFELRVLPKEMMERQPLPPSAGQ